MSNAERERLELDGEMLESISLVHRRTYPECVDHESEAVSALLQVLDTPDGVAEDTSTILLVRPQTAVTTH